MKNKKNKKKILIALAMIIGVSLFNIDFNTNKEKKKVMFGDFSLNVTQKIIEVNVGDSDASIIDAAKFAVSATYEGVVVDNKELSVTTDIRNIAEIAGEFTHEFTYSYKSAKKIVALTIRVHDKKVEESTPTNPVDVSSSKKIAVVKNAINGDIVEGEMSVQGLDNVYVSTKGFGAVDNAAEVVESTDPKSEFIKTDDMSAIDELNKSEVNTEDLFVDADAATQPDGSIDINDEESVSSEIESDGSSVIKPTADLLILKMADGSTVNLSSNLSGSILDTTAKLQQTDGLFVDILTGNAVDFHINSITQTVIEGYGLTTVYNTNCGLYYSI